MREAPHAVAGATTPHVVTLSSRHCAPLHRDAVDPAKVLSEVPLACHHRRR